VNDIAMSPAEADAKSQARSTRNQRTNAIALVIIMILFSVSGALLVHQDRETSALLEQQRIEAVRQANNARETCIQRRENVLKANNTWAGLAAVEERNTSQPEDIKKARIALYKGAMLDIPDCTKLKREGE
jgi:hypothetical protein